MNDINRIIANTSVLYASLLVKMLIGFFTVRFVLIALGETDYGIYMIVAGVVGMLDILSGNMSNTSMRFLAHSLGSKDPDLIKKTFNTTLYIHYLVGILTVFILEIGGWIMFEWLLIIPEDRITTAIIIYQFMVATSFITVIAVPYDAIMNAYEHIYILSVFEIIGSILSLGCAVYLMNSDGDRLITYGFYLFFIQIILRIIKVAFAKKHYQECEKLQIGYFNRKIFKSITSFTVWNLFGSIAALGSTQFRSIIINNFFGVKLNAAEGVAMQASNAINMVVASMTRAINPQIMKNEGRGERKRMLFIVEMGAKYSTFLFALIGVPLLFELPYLLDVWLDKVPEFAVIFCQLLMISMLIEKLTFQITHAIRAVGDIRNFQVVESLVCLLYLPFAYFAFKRGMPPATIYFLAICSNLLTVFVRIYFGRKVAQIDIKSYIRNAIIAVLIPVIIASIVTFLFVQYTSLSIFRVAGTFLIFWLVYLPLFWLFGMQVLERDKWKQLLGNVICKFRKNN
ncbi:MAG: oligosaccharide flippase family protein [Clostridia bacterium]|nr:oligosaccharide flippase family protein [Clostridia bacterium]